VRNQTYMRAYAYLLLKSRRVDERPHLERNARYDARHRRARWHGRPSGSGRHTDHRVLGDVKVGVLQHAAEVL